MYLSASIPMVGPMVLVMLTPQYLESGARPAGLLPLDHSLITARINQCHETSTRNHRQKCEMQHRGARERGRSCSLMKDQMKQTTFCAKLRNARWSNRRASGPNRFVDLRKESPVNCAPFLPVVNTIGESEREGWDMVLTAFPGGRPG